MKEKLIVFISQPMLGRTDEEVLAERDYAIEVVKTKYPDKEIEVLETYFQEEKPDYANDLYYLANSLVKMATANLVVFVPGWERARGCKIEWSCVTNYNIPFLCI